MRHRDVLIALLLHTTIVSAQPVPGIEELKHAMELHDRGSYAEAISIYEELLAKHPDNPHLLYEIGLSSRAAGELDDCISYATQSAAAQPRADSFSLLGSCHDDKGDRETALRAFEQGAQIAPRDVALNFNYAVTLARLGRYAEARERAAIAIEGRPTYPSPYFVYALALDGVALHGAAALMHLRSIMWESHTPRARSAATLIVAQLNGYRDQAKQKKLVISGMPKTPSPDTDLVLLDLAFGMSAQLSSTKLPANATDADRFVNVLTDVVTVAGEIREKAPGGQFVWQYAAGPVLQLAQRGLLETYLFAVAAMADQQGATSWLNAHNDEVRRLTETLRELRQPNTVPQMQTPEMQVHFENR
ncbi:MAG TPA: tetratricopeptide repeat protein [Steroidobacteraceae bacterium]|nr:tetratricopeptide repeat protein [Steroidobacteraceae bacterium]